MIGNLALQVSIKKVEPHSHGDHNILQPSQVYHGERTLVCQGMARDGNRSPLVDGAMVRDYRIHIATLLMEPLWLRGQSMVSIDGNSYGQVWGDHLPIRSVPVFLLDHARDCEIVERDKTWTNSYDWSNKEIISFD